MLMLLPKCRLLFMLVVALVWGSPGGPFSFIPGNGSAHAQQNVVIVIDDSGSMSSRMRGDKSSTRMDAARRALNKVLGDVPDSAQVGVLSLNSNAESNYWIIPMGPLDRSAIQSQIDGIIANGGTPLGAAIKEALNVLLDLRQRQMYGSYRILVVTDGEAGDPQLVDRYAPLARTRGIMLDVIGVDMERTHSLATLANTYRRADDPRSLETAIADVFAETVDDSGDAGQSDYDLLSGLPSEVASAALASLARVDNSSIDQDTEGSAALSGVPNASNAPTPGTPLGSATEVNSGGSMMMLGLICLLSMAAVVIGIPILLLQLIKRAGKG